MVRHLTPSQGSRVRSLFLSRLRRAARPTRYLSPCLPLSLFLLCLPVVINFSSVSLFITYTNNGHCLHLMYLIYLRFASVFNSLFCPSMALLVFSSNTASPLPLNDREPVCSLPRFHMYTAVKVALNIVTPFFSLEYICSWRWAQFIVSIWEYVCAIMSLVSGIIVSLGPRLLPSAGFQLTHDGLRMGSCVRSVGSWTLVF